MNYFSFVKHQGKCGAALIGQTLTTHEILPLIDPERVYGTWETVSDLEGRQNVKYGKFLTSKSNLTDLCPEEIKGDWEVASKKLKAFLKTFYLIKADPQKWCIFDFVPAETLEKYCQIKTKIIQNHFETTKIPKNYDLLVRTGFLVDEISRQKLNLVKPHKNPFIFYDPMKSRTGRLTTRKGTFPILSLKKEERASIKPNNDFFVSLDYNGFDLRTFLFLSGYEQPDEDIHEWNIKHIFKSSTREEAKKALFSWLYDDRDNFSASQIYHKAPVVEQYYDASTKTVENPFGRVISDVDSAKALSYIVQSTAGDLFLDRACDVRDFLRGKQTKIAILLHDELVLDFSKQDLPELNKMIKLFQDTKLGKLPITLTVFNKTFSDIKYEKFIQIQ